MSVKLSYQTLKIKMKKLIPLTDYVNDILTYVAESNNYERAVNLIKWYAEFIQMPLNLDMFRGQKPLFPGFEVTGCQAEGYSLKMPKSIYPWGENEFGTCIKIKDNVYSSSFHLKTIEDLTKKVCNHDIEIFYDHESELGNCPELD